MSGPPDLSLRVIELLCRYEHGHFSPAVRERLASIFRENPTDAVERLERAAEYLGLDGSEADKWASKPLTSEQVG